MQLFSIFSRDLKSVGHLALTDLGLWMQFMLGPPVHQVAEFVPPPMRELASPASPSPPPSLRGVAGNGSVSPIGSIVAGCAIGTFLVGCWHLLYGTNMDLGFFCPLKVGI